MANEHSIRVSARGEFGQLERGLKNLQKDLKSVLGEIDKGARRGGLFDDTQLRALDVYRTRFKHSMDEINREMQKQNDTIDQLHRRRQNSSRDEQKNIDEEIRRREKALDVLRKQIIAVEDLYSRRSKEARTYNLNQPMGGGMTGGAQTGGGLLTAGMMKAFGMGKFMMGLAGIGGIATMAQQAYMKAYNSQVTPMNLSQRLRGTGVYGGSAKNMWDTIGAVGRNDSMGYTSEESWQFQDIYSRQAGALDPNSMEHLMKFGRGYGLEVGETAGVMGQIRELGGSTTAVEFANMIASSVSQSGMTPRILEVMETSAGLLEQMATTLKDGSAHEILGYQTILDKLGTENGMYKLTGSGGADIIGGLGGIFNPNQGNDWKWMGIQALQQYNPQKYGKMGLYDLETSFEDGLHNTDNIAAMTQYLRGKSGGDENTMKRMLQRWLQDGGYNATKQQVNDLYEVTDGFTAFDSEKVNSVVNSLDKGDGTAKYQERMGQLGQNILDTNSRFEKQLENLGQPILATVQGMKEGITGILEDLNTDTSEQILEDIRKFMEDNLIGLATAAGLVALAPAIAKALGGGNGGGDDGDGKGKGKGGRPPIVPVGTKNMLKTGAKIFTGISLFDALIDSFSSEDGASHKKMAKKAGVEDPSWFDRFFTTFTANMIPGMDEQDVYNSMNTAKWGDSIEGFMKTLFPSMNVPTAKEDQERLRDVATKKDLSWHQYANPKNWGDMKIELPKEWGENFKEMKEGFFNDFIVPMNEAFGWDIGGEKKEAAVNSLVSLGSTGTVSIEGLTEHGKAKLQQLADEGLIKLEEGKQATITNLSGFTEEGKTKLTQLASEGLISIGGFTNDGKAKLTVLSEEGRAKLEKLKEDGLIDIGKFKTDGTKNIVALNEEGAKQLIDLQKSGSLHLSSMDTTTTTKLEDVRKKTETNLSDIKAEHVSLSEKLVGKDGIFTKWADATKGVFEDLGSWWKENMPGWLGGGGDSTIGSFNGEYKGKYADIINKAAKEYGVDPYLIASVIGQESGFNPNATSGAGAMGLMQLMPGTAAGLGVGNAYDPEQNVMGGTKHLARLIEKYKGNVEHALYAYNAGEGNVDQWIREGRMHNIPFKETKNYAPSIMERYQDYMASMGGGKNFFDDWQKRVTSNFQSQESFRSSPHRGLDIDGKQGDPLQALAGGVIDFIHYDDGSKRDKDGRKNTRAGGTEMGVRMPNGEVYFYSHLSNVNPNLKVGSKVGKGDWVGNVGGDPGMAGSGSSTTGSHLHLGYMNKNGTLKDPTALLKSLSSGDSGIGTMVASGSTVKKVEVTLKLEGDGVAKLNDMTKEMMAKIAEQVIKNYEAQKLLLNPTM